MIKIILVPSDEYFEENVLQLRRAKSIKHIDVIVDGHATLCQDVRVVPNGLFGFTKRLSLGESRVNMSAILRVMFYLEV